MKSNLERLDLELAGNGACVVSKASEEEEYASCLSAECTASCELALGKYEEAERMLLFDCWYQIGPEEWDHLDHGFRDHDPDH